MICAFTRNGYLRRDEVYSVDSGGNDLREVNNYRNYPVIIDLYSTSHEFDNNEWNENWHTEVHWTVATGQKSGDFDKYMNDIESSSEDYFNSLRRFSYPWRY